ncbi:MAG: hypothetical protein CND85_04555 [Marine Group II euryarchaeote MED-G33]|nr:MAG: hypothetical protein CND85_04555 [Marine Group II euryarchaeote MED-G33]
MGSASRIYQGTRGTPHQTAKAIRTVVVDDFTKPFYNQRIVLTGHQTVRTTHTQVIDDIQNCAIKNRAVMGWARLKRGDNSRRCLLPECIGHERPLCWSI